MNKVDMTKLALLFKKVRIGKLIIYGNKLFRRDYEFEEQVINVVKGIALIIFYIFRFIFDSLPRFRWCKESVNEIKKKELCIKNEKISCRDLIEKEEIKRKKIE